MTMKLLALAVGVLGLATWTDSTTASIRSVDQAEAAGIIGACYKNTANTAAFCGGSTPGGQCSHSAYVPLYDTAPYGNKLGPAVCADEPQCTYQTPNGAMCNY